MLDAIKGFPWDELIKNLASQVGDVFVLVEVVAYLLGIIFLTSAFFLAVKATKPNSDTSKFAWAWSLIFASFMFVLPTTIGSLSSTIFGDASMAADNPFAYMKTVTGTGKLAPLVPILAVIGVIAVIRGLMVLRMVGMYGGRAQGSNTFSRGMVLLIAGTLLVNMKKTLGLVSGLTGLNLGAGLF